MLAPALCGWDLIFCPWVLYEQFNCIWPTVPPEDPSPLNSVIYDAEVISKFPELLLIPFITGEVRVLFVKVCVVVNWTISPFDIPEILVAVVAFPVSDPANAVAVTIPVLGL